MKKKNENLLSVFRMIAGNQRGDITIATPPAAVVPTVVPIVAAPITPIANSMGNTTTGEPITTNTPVVSGTPVVNSEADKLDVSKLPQNAQDLIKSLRGESADHRTKNNNLTTRLDAIENGFKTMFGEEGSKLTPEQQIEQLQSSQESASYENAVMGMAYENNVPHANLEYFSFLMEKAVKGLTEGQELSEEQLTGIVGQAKQFAAVTADQTNTTVTEDNLGNQNPVPTGDITLEAFTAMSVPQKSELYRKSPAIYNSLFSQAREKRLL